MFGVAAALFANMRDLKREKMEMPTQEIEHGEALFFENGMLINASPEVKTIFTDLDIPIYERGLLWVIWALLGNDAVLPNENGRVEFEGQNNTQIYITRAEGKYSVHILCADGPAHIAMRLAISGFLAKTYRGLCESSPTAMSVTNLGGDSIVENNAFVHLTERLDLDQIIEVPQNIESGDSIAVQTATKEGAHQQHFDVQVTRKDNLLNFDIRDSSDRHFVHQNVQTFRRTMTQTFADLSVGLGVFDNDQHLITFNPALVELLGLPITFLSQRPSLFSFFANLRETGVMPEPENFAKWQEGLLQMVDESSDGVFNEIWYGLEGRALRVMGRPHPSGGFSFLVEDISKDIALQKMSKAQIRAHQFMIDKISIPMAAFDVSGELITKNAAFETLLLQAKSKGGDLNQFSSVMRHISEFCTVNTAHMPDNGTLIWTEGNSGQLFTRDKKKHTERTFA